MSLYIDLSEFLTSQITTGIQRIAGEMCRYLPPKAAIPVRVHSGTYIALPVALITAIGKYFREPTPSGAAEIRRLGAGESGRPIRLSAADTVLVPEVFDNPQRLAVLRAMAEQDWQRVRFIVYDLLPITHPEYFHADGVVAISGYYQLIRRAARCGFISEYTRDVYYRRLRRTDIGDGIVLPLGCDSLGPRAERPALNRQLTFSVLGTIEPRKNHELILEAFEPLLREIDGLTLSFIGKMGWVEAEFARKVRALASDPNSGFRFHSAPGDNTIRSYIEQSRATIYVSTAEGYGLPPVESLWVGTPVIASTTIPSLHGLGTRGIHYVEPLTAVNLRQAVLAFLDNAYANQKTEETMHLNLPIWKSFTQEVLRWCEQESADSLSVPA
jgi:glycosyltransferase involved in cell wall biosynthesis